MAAFAGCSSSDKKEANSENTLAIVKPTATEQPVAISTEICEANRSWIWCRASIGCQRQRIEYGQKPQI